MPVFSQVETQVPPAFIVVPPHAFASTWAERPDEDVTMGLRYVADQDLEDARIEALRRAERLVPNHTASIEHTDVFIATFHDTLLRWIIARGTCDPNNAHKPWEGWAVATEDVVVEMALTDHGCQLIFDAWERMRIASNIGLSIATDDDIACMPELLLRLPTMTDRSPTQAMRLRRLLRFVLEELESVEVPETDLAPKAPQNVTSRDEPSLSGKL